MPPYQDEKYVPDEVHRSSSDEARHLHTGSVGSRQTMHRVPVIKMRERGDDMLVQLELLSVDERPRVKFVRPRRVVSQLHRTD